MAQPGTAGQEESGLRWLVLTRPTASPTWGKGVMLGHPTVGTNTNLGTAGRGGESARELEDSMTL